MHESGKIPVVQEKAMAAAPEGHSHQALSLPAVTPPAGSFPEQDNGPSDVVQEKTAESNSGGHSAFHPSGNGLPAQLRRGIEQMSGFSLKNVKVQYNSDKPAQLQAHAFAQGNSIHLAPGQERHLPHEAWHVVQQQQGRVQGTVQRRDIAINDDPSLEKEADEMGAKAAAADSYASGFEHLNRSDVGTVQARSSLVSVSQRNALELINNSIETRSETGAQATAASGTVQRVNKQLIVEEGDHAEPFQMTKATFLSGMRQEIKKIAQPILEPEGLMDADCPDLSYWINYYAAKDADYIHEAMLRYAPATAMAEDAGDFITLIAERVKTGLAENMKTADPEAVDPETMPESEVAVQEDNTETPMQLMSYEPVQLKKKPRTGQRQVEKLRKYMTGTPEQRIKLGGKMFDAHQEMMTKNWIKEKQEGKKVPLTEEVYRNSELGKRELATRKANEFKHTGGHAEQLAENYKKNAENKKLPEFTRKKYLELIALLQKPTPKGKERELAVQHYIMDTLDGCSGTAAQLSLYVFDEDITADPIDQISGEVLYETSRKNKPRADIKEMVVTCTYTPAARPETDTKRLAPVSPSPSGPSEIPDGKLHDSAPFPVSLSSAPAKKTAEPLTGVLTGPTGDAPGGQSHGAPKGDVKLATVHGEPIGSVEPPGLGASMSLSVTPGTPGDAPPPSTDVPATDTRSLLISSVDTKKEGGDDNKETGTMAMLPLPLSGTRSDTAVSTPLLSPTGPGPMLGSAAPDRPLLPLSAPRLVTEAPKDRKKEVKKQELLYWNIDRDLSNTRKPATPLPDRSGDTSDVENLMNCFKEDNTFYYVKSLSQWSHHFVVVRYGGTYDLYESDFNKKPESLHIFPEYQTSTVENQTIIQKSKDVVQQKIVGMLKRASTENAKVQAVFLVSGKAITNAEKK